MKLLPLLAASLLATDAPTPDTLSVPENTVTVSIQMTNGRGGWADVYVFRVLSEERANFRILITEDQ